MKRPALLAIAAIIAVVAMVIIAIRTNLTDSLLSLICTDKHESQLFPQSFYDCEDLIHQGQFDEARRIINQGKAQATDSDSYYRYVVLDTKRHFYTMNADSFIVCSHTLSGYISRQRHRTDKGLLRLKMESEMQHGVYEARMTGRMDSAQAHNLRALALLEQLPYDAGYRLMALSNIADVYKQLGRYDQSVSYYRQAMELGDSTHMNDNVRATLTMGIASAYAAMGSFERSAQWWDRAAGLKSHMGRTERFHFLNNRGNDYFLQERYKESLACFLELDSMLAGDESMKWERMYGRANLSDVYIKLGQPRRATALLDQTQPFFTEHGQLLPLYYLITQRIELAVAAGHYDEALQLDRENPTPSWMIPEQIQLRRRVMATLYERTGQWQHYSETLRQYAELHDSIANDNMKMRFSSVLMEYEHEKQLLEKQKLIEEKELSFRWAAILLLAAILVIILIVIITIMKLRERRMREAEMRGSIAQLRMTTVRNRITPHFISNALTAEMLAQTEGREPHLDSLVQLLHRGIELTDIEQTTLTDELEFIRFYCSIESRSVGPDFALHIDVADDIDTDHVLLPSMSVQILVENAIKHGLKARQPQPGQQRTVSVIVSKQPEATLIEVIDNGVGLAEERTHRERTGLRVVRQTIQLLNEQNQQTTRKHKCLMDYGLENYTHPDGERGCRAWLLLPGDFEYKLRKLKEPQ